MGYLQRLSQLVFFVLFMAVAVSAGPLIAEQESTLKITVDGETVLEAAPLPAAELTRVRTWLSRPPSGAKITSSGATVKGTGVDLVVTAEIAKRWGSDPAALAAVFADQLQQNLGENLSWGSSGQLVPLSESREVALRPMPKNLEVTVSASDPQVLKVEKIGAGRYRLTGLQPGRSQLLAVAADGREVPSLPVQVKPWAARWGDGPQSLEFTGAVDAKRIQVALNRWLGARALMGARVEMTGLKAVEGASVWKFQVTAASPEAISVDKSFTVNVVAKPSAPMKPAEVLFLSNHPEKIFDEGLLYQRRASAANFRIMWHHRNDPEGPDRYLITQLTNPGPTARKMRMLWSSYGPSPDEIHVGHTAALTFAVDGMGGNSEIITLPPNGSRTIEIRRVKAGQTMSGLVYLCDVSGASAPLEFSVFSSNGDGPLSNEPVVSRDPGRTASGVFPAQVVTEETHTLGGPFTYVAYGGEPYVTDIGGEQPSYGNFGTYYRTRLMLHNPFESPRQAQLAFQSGGGAARGVLLVDGTLYDLPMGRPGDGVPVTTFDLAPGEVRQVDIELMPQAGSNYPIRLLVRSDFERLEKKVQPPSRPHRTLIP